MTNNIDYILKEDLRNNISNLYDFYIAAKCKNLKQAAILGKTSYTTLSRSIRNLEAKCKLELIIPTNRGIELTKDGEKLYNILVKFFN